MFIFLLSIDASSSYFFFFNDTATTEIYTLSLHDALPIWDHAPQTRAGRRRSPAGPLSPWPPRWIATGRHGESGRSEEHTSELQSRLHLVCRLLLEKKKDQRLALEDKYMLESTTCFRRRID